MLCFLNQPVKNQDHGREKRDAADDSDQDSL